MNRNRNVSPRSAPSGAGSMLSKILVVVAILFLGLVVYTIINGELRLPFGGGVVFAFDREQEQTQANGLPAGTVAVYGCPRELPAFTKITRDHLLTADGLYVVPVVEEAIESNGLFRNDVEGLQRLLGRVLRRPKPVNFAFKESDFLPKGTRPGPSAGIPPGKRGVWVDIADVRGLSDLNAGDRVDLVAAESVTPKAATARPKWLGQVTDPVLKTRLDGVAAMPKAEPAARSWVLARQALVVQPERERKLPEGAGKKAATVTEVLLALAPEEVSKFSRALARKVEIVAAPRSGQPESGGAEIEDSQVAAPAVDLEKLLHGDGGTPGSLGMVEVIRGGERSTITVPRSPEESAQKTSPAQGTGGR
ncbi:MAG: hypothetical protein NXI31_11895 [bacterium]|nr:hypothetical protein [bacterium]